MKAMVEHSSVAQEALIQLNKLKFLPKSLWSTCSESAHSLMS